MVNLDKVQKAFADLELEPSASRAEMIAQHKRLVRIFHSDRMQRPEDKALADKKLARFNSARDLLEIYFAETVVQEEQVDGQPTKNEQPSKNEQPAESAAPSSYSQPESEQTIIIKSVKFPGARRAVALSALAATLLIFGFMTSRGKPEPAMTAREPLAEEQRIDTTGAIAAARRAEQEAHEAREDARLKTLLLARQRGTAKSDVDRYERAIAQDKANISELKARLATDIIANTSRRSLEIELNNRQNDLIAMQRSYDEALRQFQEIDGFRPEDRAYDEYNRLRGVTR